VEELAAAIAANGLRCMELQALVVTEDGARPLTRFTKDIHGSLDQ